MFGIRTFRSRAAPAWPVPWVVCLLRGPGGSVELLFNEAIDGPRTWTGSTLAEVGGDGEYFVETDDTESPWTLELEAV